MGDRTPGRRRSDLERHRLIRWRENWYRDVWLLLTTALVAWALLGQNNVLDDVRRVQDEQREGRRAAVQVTCAATSAVIDAGRATIIGGAQNLDPEFTASLERLGYPPVEVRQAQAQKAAKAYAKAIANRVETATGFTGIVNENGTLNCAKLADLSRVD